MENVYYFGIRHLSPSGAWHLIKYLDELKPDAVLVEGPSDATPFIHQLVLKETIPPIAILAYTNQIPVRTILYPFATYSPEYQALKWAEQHHVYSEFIDLPTSVTLSLEAVERNEENERVDEENLYEKWAKSAGEDDHETYWERHFEHNLNKDTYRLAAIEFGKSIRALGKEHQFEHALNTLREAFMKRRLIDIKNSGYQKVVVITGAYHTAQLESEKCIPLNDQELINLPKTDSSITLMPYSYLRLSSRTGYGAGNHAPYYYELMWEAINKNDLSDLSFNYLSRIAGYLREQGNVKSTAEVIEAVRLANTLSAMHEGSAPTLFDLRDAATVCLGHGEFINIAEAVMKVEIGTKIGRLPEGSSRTSIQDDFYRELKRLNLEKFKTNVATSLDLDLRENRRVKSEEAAYLDLNRSYFLYRLKLLGISFVEKQHSNQQSATWSERWVLKWSEEAEIQLVEAVLLGETIELACAYVLKEKLDNCQTVHEAAKVIRLATECGLMESMEYALKVLQSLATDSGEFVDFSEACLDLSVVIRYKDIRRYDSIHFIPLLSQLFLRATLLLIDAANCDNQSANSIIEAISVLNHLALEHTESLDDPLWIKQLIECSNRDNLNPKVSGYACAILLERGELKINDLQSEISRRLSPGIEADVGTGWFEGLALKNRYVLLSKLELWEQIDVYISSLDDEQFKRALVFLRRAFSSFIPQEKQTIAQNLGQVWNLNQDATAEYLNNDLSKDEQETINELANFDFGDF